jgi:Uma2 family endonuclease
MKLRTAKPPANRHGSNGRPPTWDIALLFPEQGNWSVEEYLDLPGNRLVEFSEGYLEVLPVPTTSHQWILSFVLRLLDAFVTAHGLGLALPAGIRVQLWPRKFRQADIVFMLTAHRARVGEEYWTGADLVMEVVSAGPEDRRRDLVTKRREYARARIGEYWIIDPKLGQITVLRLRGKRYEVHGQFKGGDEATSRLLPGFQVNVASVFAGPP